jgi:hypothetical protein
MTWAGRYWDQTFREKHFTSAGATEYGYTPREGERGNPSSKGFRRSYTGRKLRKFGHTRPLEYTGESRRRTRSPRIVATAKRGEALVRIKMDSPGLNRRYSGSRINMRQEMTTVSTREGEQINTIVGRFLEKRYQIAATKRKRF